MKKLHTDKLLFPGIVVDIRVNVLWNTACSSRWVVRTDPNSGPFVRRVGSLNITWLGRHGPRVRPIGARRAGKRFASGDRAYLFGTIGRRVRIAILVGHLSLDLCIIFIRLGCPRHLADFPLDVWILARIVVLVIVVAATVSPPSPARASFWSPSGSLDRGGTAERNAVLVVIHVIKAIATRLTAHVTRIAQILALDVSAAKGALVFFSPDAAIVAIETCQAHGIKLLRACHAIGTNSWRGWIVHEEGVHVHIVFGGRDWIFHGLDRNHFILIRTDSLTAPIRCRSR